MRLLRDTAVLLWLSYDAPRLSAPARAAYADPGNDRFINVASLWEIIVQNRLGELPLPVPVEQMIEPLTQSGAVRVLPLNQSAVLRLGSSPTSTATPSTGCWCARRWTPASRWSHPTRSWPATRRRRFGNASPAGWLDLRLSVRRSNHRLRSPLVLRKSWVLAAYAAPTGCRSSDCAHRLPVRPFHAPLW